MSKIKVKDGLFIDYELVEGDTPDDVHVKICIEADPDDIKQYIFLIFQKITNLLMKLKR
jgi:hypothetical protein